MKILISGGAGFLGSHLCGLFLSKGHCVTAVDNFLTGNKNNIKRFLKNKNFRFKKIDVIKDFNLREKVDAVLHFASPASPVDYVRHQIETLQVGSAGTYNMLNLAKKNNAKFLFASTSEIYGDPLVNPQTETYWGNVNPVGKRSMYDEAKRFSEALITSFRNVYGVDAKIARIFNTYGPGMNINDGRAVPEFISQALSGRPVVVFGKGTQTRSFCFVSDLVRGIYELLMSNEYLPVNIGNPSEITMNELAKIIIKLTGSKSKIVYKPLPEDDPKRRKPDISKAVKILKWKPEVELEDGLNKTIEYFKSLKKR